MIDNHVITIIRDPVHVLGKVFTLNPDGTVTKKSAVSIVDGRAVMRHVPDLVALKDVILEVADDPHAAIMAGGFHGIEIGETVRVMSESKLDKLGHPRASLTGQPIITELNGKPIKTVARLKEFIYPSCWQYFDRDVDGHTPEQHGYEQLPFDHWLEVLEKIVPGASRVDLLRAHSSSARVLKPDGTLAGGGNGHVWFEIADPGDLERFKHSSILHAKQIGLTWRKPRFSRKEPGKIIGYSDATIFDNSVFDPGRLIFVGKPTVGAGLVLRPQETELIEGLLGGSLNTCHTTFDQTQVERIYTDEGRPAKITNDGKRVRIDIYDLRFDTEIEQRGKPVTTVKELLPELTPGSKIRCQTPFRASESEAAFLSCAADGRPFIFDVGTSEWHWLCNEDCYRADFAVADSVINSGKAVDAIAPETAINPVEHLAEHIVSLDSLTTQPDYFLPHYIEMWIPQDEVTLLAGHGGGGKSYVALSIAVHVALGLPFGTLGTQQANVLFFSGEDGAPVLRQRLGRICRALKIDPLQLEGRLHLLDASDIDPALHREQRVTIRGWQQVVTETVLLDALAALVVKLNVGLVVIDNASDAYDDDEIKRARVRTFIRSLRSHIARPGRAVLLLAHINKASAKERTNTEDYSGSTAWHNSVRSRLSLITDGPDGLNIEHLKANLGPRSSPVRMVWHEGVPVVASSQVNGADDAAANILRAAERERDTADKAALVSLIQDFDRRGERVTTSMHGSYTVHKLLKSHAAFPKGMGSDKLIRLLRELESEGHIFRRTVRTPDRKKKEVFTCVSDQAESAPNAEDSPVLSDVTAEECANEVE